MMIRYDLNDGVDDVNYLKIDDFDVNDFVDDYGDDMTVMMLNLLLKKCFGFHLPCISTTYIYWKKL